MESKTLGFVNASIILLLHIMTRPIAKVAIAKYNYYHNISISQARIAGFLVT